MFLCFGIVYVFFFKQNTAYEMRISDWSSDVCSSDLSWPAERFGLARQASRRFLIVTSHGGRILLEIAQDLEFELFGCQWVAENGFERARPEGATSEQFGFFAGQCVGYRQLVRSEEHTSELQSLMRISYAVFCLKQKK